jgi:hypothetical protein
MSHPIVNKSVLSKLDQSEDRIKDLKVLLDAEEKGNLTELGEKHMQEIRDLTNKFMIVSIVLRLITKCVDPHGKKNPIAAVSVGGRSYDFFPFLNTNKWNAALGILIGHEMTKGKNTISRDIADLSIITPVFNKQGACLLTLWTLYDMQGCWPTKKLLSIACSEIYPELFQNFDDKEWRRLRKSLDIEWLEDGKRGVKKGGKFK